MNAKTPQAAVEEDPDPGHSSLTGHDPERLVANHGVANGTQTTDRQIADRARDHLYN